MPRSATLLGAAEVRRLADELDLRPSKQRGQNFVIDGNTVRRIVRDAGVGPDDVVIEIGPGLGSLTLALLEVAQHVVAVEVDDRLAALLPRTVAEHAPDLVGPAHRRRGRRAAPRPPSTARRRPHWSPTSRTTSPSRCCCTCSSCCPSLEKGLVMVQAEVADRLAAPPGSRTYGVPSVKAAWYADVRRRGDVSRSIFWPVPNVDSGLVAWERRDPPATTATREQVFAVDRRRLRAAPQDACAPRSAAMAATPRRPIVAAGVDPMARGEVLDVAAFARIAEELAAAA